MIVFTPSIIPSGISLDASKNTITSSLLQLYVATQSNKLFNLIKDVSKIKSVTLLLDRALKGLNNNCSLLVCVKLGM
jgi:hypothetical protein